MKFESKYEHFLLIKCPWNIVCKVSTLLSRHHCVNSSFLQNEAVHGFDSLSILLVQIITLCLIVTEWATKVKEGDWDWSCDLFSCVADAFLYAYDVSVLFDFQLHDVEVCTLQWRDNKRGGVSNHQRLDYLLSRLLGRRLNTHTHTPKLRVTGLSEGNSPVTGEFPAQRASNAENVSIWWRWPSCYFLIWIVTMASHWYAIIAGPLFSGIHWSHEEFPSHGQQCGIIFTLLLFWTRRLTNSQEIDDLKCCDDHMIV